MIVALVEKLDHRLPDIRDRSMRAICRKILSPVTASDSINMLSRCEGVAHLFLRWLNDRYDSVPMDFLTEALDSVSVLLSKSEELRMLFIEAGAISFLEDFVRHNPVVEAQGRAIVACLMRGQVEGDNSPASTVIAQRSNSPQREVMKSIEAIQGLSTDDEQWLFDLAVRIKFCTNSAAPRSIEAMAREIRFGFCLCLPASVFFQRPALIEALCSQLSRGGPTLLPIDHMEPLAIALLEILERLMHATKDIEIAVSSVIVPVLVSSVESFAKRPDLVTISVEILRVAANLLGKAKLNPIQAEPLVRSLAKVSGSIFRQESYRVERMTFADGSSASVRRLIEWTPFQRVIACAIIQGVSVCASGDCVALFSANSSLLAHVSDWIADDAFYDCYGQKTKSLASQAAISLAILDPEGQDNFSRARELLLCLRKDKADTALSDRELMDLFHLYRKVPELVFSNDPVSFVLKVLRNCESPSTVVEIVKQDKSLGDALASIISDKKDHAAISMLATSGRVVAELIASIKCSSLISFASLILKETGSDWLPLFNPSKSVADVSIEGLSRSLFSQSEAVRKQASIVLWKSCGQESAFVPDPVSSLFEASSLVSLLNEYRLGSMAVEVSEIEHALSLSANHRLGIDIRTASCMQACTLVANSSLSGSRVSDKVVASLKTILKETRDRQLIEPTCHVLWWLLAKDLIACDENHHIVECIVKWIFHSYERLRISALMVLFKLVFDKRALLGDLTDCEDLYESLYRRLGEFSYIVPDLDKCESETFTKSIEGPPNKAFAICVSLFGIPTKFSPKAQHVNDKDLELLLSAGQIDAHVKSPCMQKFIAGIETGIGDKLTEKTLSKSIRIARRCGSLETCQAICTAITDAFSRISPSCGILCEFLSAALFSTLVTKDVSVLDSLAHLEISEIEVWRCVLRLAVACCSLKPIRTSPLLLRGITRLVSGPSDRFCHDAIFYILCSIGENKADFDSIVSQSLDIGALLSQVINRANICPLEWRFLRLMLVANRLSASDSILLYQRCMQFFQDAESANFDRFSLSESLYFAAEMIRMSPSLQEKQLLTNPIIDVVSADLVFDFCNCESLIPLVVAVAEVRGKELSHIFIHNERWKWLLSSDCCLGVSLGLVATCIEADSRLLAYLCHQGLFEAVSQRMRPEKISRGLVRVIFAVKKGMEAGGPSSRFHHFEACVAWLESPNFTLLISDYLEGTEAIDRQAVFDLISVASEVLLLSGVRYSQGSNAFNSFLRISPSPICSVSGCAALTRFVRVPGALIGLNPPDFSHILEMMRTQQSVCVPDSIAIGASKGATLFFAQMKLAAAFAAAADSLVVSQAYCDWFCDLWRRTLLIVISKQTSPIPMIEELICGFLQVLGVADLGLVCWGPPLSHVLSFITRTDLVVYVNISTKVFCLCLSVAEAASAVLVRKAVTARVLSALISQHAVIHGKHIPKDANALARAGAVIHLASSLIGCKLCAAEILKSLDGWLEARHALDSDILMRLLASIVLAGGYCRGSIVANEEAVSLLNEMESNSDIAKKALAVLVTPSLSTGGG